MQELGVEQVYIDHMSGKSLDRPELKRMLSYVREGDVVIVESISRFARNTKDLLELMEKLQEKKVQFVSKKEAIDTSTPQAGLCSLSLELLQSWRENTSCRGREKELL